MEDLHKIVEGENASDNQDDSKKEKSKPSVVKKDAKAKNRQNQKKHPKLQ